MLCKLCAGNDANGEKKNASNLEHLLMIPFNR